MRQLSLFIAIAWCLNGIAQNQTKLVWQFKCHGAIHASAAIDGNSVFIGSNDSCFYALNKATGVENWHFRTAGQIKSAPCFFNGMVIFNCTDGSIYALNQKTGSLQWQFKTLGEQRYDIWDYYLSSPVSDNGNIYLGSGDSCVYSLNAQTGRLNWKFKTDGIVHATPMVSQQKVLVGSFDGWFYALDAQTGQPDWKFNTIGDRYFPKGEVQKGAAIYKNTVIFGSRDYNIYALDIATGQGLWNMKEPGWIVATPLVANDRLYFGTSDSHRFYCMNAESGNIEWIHPTNMRVYGTAANLNNQVFFGCFNGKLYGVNSQTGSTEIEFQTQESRAGYYQIYKADDTFRDDFILYGDDILKSEQQILSLGSILSSILIDNQTLYFGDANGHFYAIEID